MMIATGTCCVCAELFAFNPERVPSYGGKEICRPCVEKANMIRKRNGLSQIVIYEDSYAI